MNITIFGATGKTGVQLVGQALAAGHQVTAFARNSSKLNLKNEHLALMQGDVENAAQVEAAVNGANAIISVLGPTGNIPDYKVSRGTQNIIAAMNKVGVRRLVVSSGAGVGDPNDTPKLFNHAINFALKLMAKHIYEDMKRVVDVVHASDLDWTIVRVPMLTDDLKKGTVRVGYVGRDIGARISRADMADFMLKQVSDKTFLHQAPAISN